MPIKFHQDSQDSTYSTTESATSSGPCATTSSANSTSAVGFPIAPTIPAWSRTATGR